MDAWVHVGIQCGKCIGHACYQVVHAHVCMAKPERACGLPGMVPHFAHHVLGKNCSSAIIHAVHA